MAAIGETLYAVGGFDAGGQTAAVESYDTGADRWTSVAPLPAALQRRVILVARPDGSAEVIVLAVVPRLPRLPANVVVKLDLGGERFSGQARLRA